MNGANRGVSALLVLFLFGCGGSGSTGLITAETALFEDVRRSNACLDANETVYCPASGVRGPAGDPPPSAGEVPISPQPPGPDACSTCEIAAAIYVFDTSGLPSGTACSVATRTGTEDWRLSALEAVGSGAVFEIVALPEILEGASWVEAALVCFESPRRSPLPSSVEWLADLGPTVVFVAPELVESD